jgi:hypothetical protein
LHPKADYGSQVLRGVPRGVFCFSPGGTFPSGRYLGVDMPLTDTEARKARLSDKPYRLSDAGSLYLWITPAVGKLWRWTYKFGGTEKLMSFGKYPDVPLALARDAGFRILRQRQTVSQAKRCPLSGQLTR